MCGLSQSLPTRWEQVVRRGQLRDFLGFWRACYFTINARKGFNLRAPGVDALLARGAAGTGRRGAARCLRVRAGDSPAMLTEEMKAASTASVSAELLGV